MDVIADLKQLTTLPTSPTLASGDLPSLRIGKKTARVWHFLRLMKQDGRV
jgi:hypothetical protein